jgi:hypothetical protein
MDATKEADVDRNIVEIGEGVWIYLPRGLTPEQETKVIAHYLGSFEPEAHEVQCKKLLRQHVDNENAISLPASSS